MTCFYDLISKSIKNKGKLGLIIFLGILLALCQIGRSYYVGIIIQYLNQRDIVKYAMITVFSYIIIIILYLQINSEIIIYDNNLFQTLSDKILHAEFKEVLNHHTTMLSNMNESINHLNYISDIFYSIMIPQIILILFTVIVFLYYLPKVGIVLIGIIICIFFIQKSIINKLNKKWTIYWDKYNNFNKEFQDVMLNIWNIKYKQFRGCCR